MGKVQAMMSKAFAFVPLQDICGERRRMLLAASGHEP